jgi:membrane-bound serine protease (ClpP class)
MRRSTLALAALALLAAFSLGALGDDPIDEAQSGLVLHMVVDSIIHPVAEEYIAQALADADERDAQLLVIELNTPGGLLTSTRSIFTEMLEADTPVVVYVSPKGSQAASAGFFLLMAADIAAMAPGTNTGAAHPVGGQGEDIEGVMAEKVEQDAAATIRSLAAQRGRNEQLAESAVIEALQGRKLSKDGKDLELELADALLEPVVMTPFQRLRSAIAHPNVAYLLMTFGGLGLYFELSNPGAIFPGVIGAICLVLAFYALSILPVNYAGIALMILASIFFLLELKVPSFGLLTAGGIISLVLGSVLLFESADPAIRVSLQLIFGVAAFSAVVVGVLASLVLRVHRRKPATGQEGLVKQRGVARTELKPRGKVSVHGEIWNAEASAPVERGEEIEIVAVEGMTLKVQPSHS